MSVYSDVITAVKARVDTVSNIGMTHAYERWNADWSTYLDQFKATIGSTVQIRGWIVTMDERDPIVGNMEGASRFGAISRTYNVLIYGVLGLKDADNTETTFLNLVEEVLNAVDGRTDLGISSVVDYGVGPATVRTYQKRQFGSILCHYCEIAVPVEVQVSLSYA